jgi:hypothetical protein
MEEPMSQKRFPPALEAFLTTSQKANSFASACDEIAAELQESPKKEALIEWATIARGYAERLAKTELPGSK